MCVARGVLPDPSSVRPAAFAFPVGGHRVGRASRSAASAFGGLRRLMFDGLRHDGAALAVALPRSGGPTQVDGEPTWDSARASSLMVAGDWAHVRGPSAASRKLRRRRASRPVHARRPSGMRGAGPRASGARAQRRIPSPALPLYDIATYYARVARSRRTHSGLPDGPISTLSRARRREALSAHVCPPQAAAAARGDLDTTVSRRRHRLTRPTGRRRRSVPAPRPRTR